MSIFNQSFHNIQTKGFLGCCNETSPSFSASRYTNGAHNEKQLLTGADQQKKQEIDTMLSEAFNALSFEERQVQQEELHGVADAIKEEPSFIENSLRELEFQINQVKSGRVYEKAERKNSDYVHDKSFRIAFLRSERYNVQAAADRMMRFFDEKEKLFGTEKLTKHITIDDLDEDDIATMKTGCIQWAGKDRSGRLIFLQVPGLRNFKDLKNELRQRYFMMMEAAKSPDAQLRGIVVLVYLIGHFKDVKHGYGWKENARLSEAIPIYPGAYHMVCDDLKQYLFMSATVSMKTARFRARSRVHFGTNLECQYHLSSYGISSELLPFSPHTSYIDLEPHLRLCQSYLSNGSDGIKHQSRQVPSSSTGGTIEPNPNDVLSAGSTKMDNVGNERLRELVKESLEAYRLGSNDEKRRIVNRIIDEIHSAGGRFLQKEKGSQTWKELPPSKVRLKMTQRFRNHNRRRETASQQAREGTLIAGKPFPNDVVFGRVERTRGTSLLHLLIKQRSEEYGASDRRKKVAVVDSIIQRIKSEGGRFLQPSASEPGGHVELSTDSVRDRISTYFRNYRRPSKAVAMTSGQ